MIVMIRELFNQLEHRMNLPKNREKPKKCVVNPTTRNEEAIHLFHRYGEEFLLRLEKYSDDEIVLNGWKKTLGMIEQIMDGEGWD